MQTTFKREISSLVKIFAFIDEFVVSHNLNESISFVMKFLAEELFTNMVKYNPGNQNDIILELNKNEHQVIIALEDFDVEPFDITKTGDVDTALSLEQRKMGGLGIHLVKKMADQITYEYENRRSRITVIKNLEKSDV